MAVLLGITLIQTGCGTRTVYAIENDKVKVAEYKGIEIKKEDPVTVDEAYLQGKFQNVVDFYNTYTGSEYEGTDDETVAAVTGGTYSTYEEWADSVRNGYTEGEAEDAITNMAQAVFSEVFSKSELLGYTQEEYDEEKAAVEAGFLSYSGASSIEEYQEMEELTSEEYAEVLDTTVLYFLKYRYVLDAIGTAEGIAPTEEEILDILCRKLPQWEPLKSSVILLDGYTGFTPVQYRLAELFMLHAREVLCCITADPREILYKECSIQHLFYMGRHTVCRLKKMAEEHHIPVEKEIWCDHRSACG